MPKVVEKENEEEMEEERSSEEEEQESESEEEKPRKKVDFSSEQKEEVNRIVQERLDRERANREEQEEKIRNDAKREALKDQEKWKELAEEYEVRIQKLEPVETELKEAQKQIGEYDKVLKRYLDKEREGLPDQVVKLLDRLTTLEQLDYLAENRDGLVRKIKPMPETPDGDDGEGKSKELSDEDKAGSRRIYRNRF